MIDPEDPVALNNRGNAEGGLKNWEQAKVDFAHAAELAPGFALANINVALTMYQLGDKAEALKRVRGLVRRYSQAADPRACPYRHVMGSGNAIRSRKQLGFSSGP